MNGLKIKIYHVFNDDFSFEARILIRAHSLSPSRFTIEH